MITSKVGKRIRELRQRKGWSQEKFASICKFDRTYLTTVELGKRNIFIMNLERIAKGLEITLAELFQFEE